MAFAQKNNLAHKFHLFTEKGNHWLLSNAFDCQITSVLPDKNNLTEDIIHPLLMSMVCNCPVISDSNPVDDTFIDNETGLLFEPNNPSDLANKILMSINRKDETKKQVAAAYKKVVENHQMRASCEYILKLYQIFKIKSDTPHWNNH